MGHYAHIILLRETDSYALFQTDGELNTARVQAGIADTQLLTRIMMFKRKQTTPERLSGRELLRHYDFVSAAQSDSKEKKADERGVPADANGLPICDYNVDFCKQCPDCISYGFAIGDAGSEKAKVYSDTGYSLTPYESSHEAFTLNAPYEGGTMSRQSETTSRINEQDHVRPQTLFPAVVTVRDATSALFLYVLNNVLRTRRYGAQTTRTGTVKNHVLAIVLADGELFSNLRLTQSLYDMLSDSNDIRPGQPVVVSTALQKAHDLVPTLIGAEPVAVNQLLAGSELERFLTELSSRTRDESGMRELLQAAQRDSAAYFGHYIQKTKGKK
jgi:CRISPR-associated protein Csc2